MYNDIYIPIKMLLHHYYKLGETVRMPNFNPNIRDKNYYPFRFSHVQSFQPIFNNLFRTPRKRERHSNDSPLNRMVLNHPYHVVNDVTVTSVETGQPLHKKVYYKIAPLLSPISYLMGEYGDYTRHKKSLITLPTADNSSFSCSKLRSYHNAGYIDAFFSFLCGQLRHYHGVFSALEFYGTYSAIQEQFRMNVTTTDTDDLESSTFFEQGLGRHFHSTEADIEIGQDDAGASTFSTHHSRRATSRRKARATTTSPSPDWDSDEESIQSEDDDVEDEVLVSSLTSSPCSKESYSTDDSATVLTIGPAKIVPRRTKMFSSYESANEPLFIDKFPVQIIAMEQCDGTLDELMMQNRLPDPEVKRAALFQITAHLTLLQRVFGFTQNDFHSNNVLWIATSFAFLHYCIGGKYYKVPTYGRLFYVADFGRAIFNYGGIVYASDDFFPGGDAEKQYNCEPFYNPNLPRIERNFSADLCRLATSLFELEFLSPSDEPTNDYQTLIRDWCLDDSGRNVLWTRDGRKRYREFKLYKMISRHVHNHVPEHQITTRPEFKVYQVDEVFTKETTPNFINVGSFPLYTDATV